MDFNSLMMGTSEEGGLVARRAEQETPEFDITAMVDLVFMMNIYFLVTFVTVALGELNLPTADHCAPLDADTAVILTVVRSLDGESVSIRVGDGDEAETLPAGSEQEERIQAAVEQGIAGGKTEVLLKAEKKVRLADLFRVATAASIEGAKLHVAVIEKDTK